MVTLSFRDVRNLTLYDRQMSNSMYLFYCEAPPPASLTCVGIRARPGFTVGSNSFHAITGLTYDSFLGAPLVMASCAWKQTTFFRYISTSSLCKTQKSLIRTRILLKSWFVWLSDTRRTPGSQTPQEAQV
jgi:hypothetical protein